MKKYGSRLDSIMTIFMVPKRPDAYFILKLYTHLKSYSTQPPDIFHLIFFYCVTVQAFAEKMEQLNLQAQQAEAMANTCIAPLTLAHSTAEPTCRAVAADQDSNANIDIFVQDVGIVMPQVDVGHTYMPCAVPTLSHNFI